MTHSHPDAGAALYLHPRGQPDALWGRLPASRDACATSAIEGSPDIRRTASKAEITEIQRGYIVNLARQRGGVDDRAGGAVGMGLLAGAAAGRCGGAMI